MKYNAKTDKIILVKNVWGEKMLTIGICDDNVYELDEICRKTKSTLKELKLEFILYQYSTLQELYNEIFEKNFNILLLDIKFEVEKKTSFDIAQKLSSISPKTQIIFITSYVNYFPDVYICNHVYCILKEKMVTKLPEAIDKAIRNINNDSSENKLISVTMNRNTQFLEVNEIIYLEKSLRKICFNCRSLNDKAIPATQKNPPNNKQIISTYASFDDYRELLPSNFVQTHRSYIVNLNYVKSLKGDRLILINDEEISISRKYKKDVLNLMMKLFFHKYDN